MQLLNVLKILDEEETWGIRKKRRKSIFVLVQYPTRYVNLISVSVQAFSLVYAFIFFLYFSLFRFFLGHDCAIK